MTEKQFDLADTVLTKWEDGDDPRSLTDVLAEEIAAAEERGRRRGVEEAASQCATTCDAAPWKERWGAHPPPWVVTRAVRDAIEGLALRDSGKLSTHNERAAIHTDKCRAGEYDTERK